jgi:hypothetical protein
LRSWNCWALKSFSTCFGTCDQGLGLEM